MTWQEDHWVCLPIQFGYIWVFLPKYLKQINDGQAEKIFRQEWSPGKGAGLLWMKSFHLYPFDHPLNSTLAVLDLLKKKMSDAPSCKEIWALNVLDKRHRSLFLCRTDIFQSYHYYKQSRDSTFLNAPPQQPICHFPAGSQCSWHSTHSKPMSLSTSNKTILSTQQFHP